MSIKINSGRQETVAAVVDFSHEDVASGKASTALHVPSGAIIVAGMIAVLEAFNSATSDVLEVGDEEAGDKYAADVDLATEGVTPIELTGEELNPGLPIEVAWTGTGAAPTAGKVRLVVQYVVKGRAAFAHGPDERAYE